MATQKAAPKVIDKATVRARNAVAEAVSSVYGAYEKTGDIVTQLCDSAQRFYRGEPIPSDDLSYIVEKAAQLRQWSEASARSRKSEARALLSHYTLLPELIRAWRAKVGGCTWHNITALAREVGKHSGKARVAAAVNALLKRGKNATDPADIARADAKAKVAQSVKRILKMKHLESDFRSRLSALCVEYRINLGAASSA
jgi:hypothetical protein